MLLVASGRDTFYKLVATAVVLKDAFGLASMYSQVQEVRSKQLNELTDGRWSSDLEARSHQTRSTPLSLLALRCCAVAFCGLSAVCEKADAVSTSFQWVLRV